MDEQEFWDTWSPPAIPENLSGWREWALAWAAEGRHAARLAQADTEVAVILTMDDAEVEAAAAAEGVDLTVNREYMLEVVRRAAAALARRQARQAEAAVATEGVDMAAQEEPVLEIVRRAGAGLARVQARGREVATPFPPGADIPRHAGGSG